MSARPLVEVKLVQDKVLDNRCTVKVRADE